MLAIAAAIALSAFWAASASAATFTVNVDQDRRDLAAGDGLCDADAEIEGEQCTLRAAVDETNALVGADTILLSKPESDYSLDAADGDDENTGGDLDIRDDLTIKGLGDTPADIEIDGQDESRIFDIFNRFEGDLVVVHTVTISNVTLVFAAGEPCDGQCEDSTQGGISIRNRGDLLLENVVISGGFDLGNQIGGAITNAGNAILRNVLIERNTAVGSGGAVYNYTGDLSIVDSIFRGNSTGDDGGAIFNGGGRVDIEGSSFFGNEAMSPQVEEAEGGAIASIIGFVTIGSSEFRGNRARSNGGAIYQGIAQQLTIRDTTIDGNAAVEGQGGGVWSDSHLQIERSTLSRNTANEGAGIYNLGPVGIVNSTISMNHAQFAGGGIFNAARGDNSARFDASTIAFNIASHEESGTVLTGTGGGVFNEDGAAMTFRSTIVTGSSIQDGRNCDGDKDGIQSDGWNMEPLEQCPFFNGENGVDDFGGFNPQIEPLQDNGGDTETHALPADSPAIDVVPPNEGGPCQFTDQRRVDRPQGGKCDIGAFELEQDGGSDATISIDDVTVTEGDSGTVAALFTVSRTGGTGASTVAWATENGSATAGSDYTGASGSVSFEGDETAQTISVSVLGDTADEADETFFVNLSGASGATLADAQGQGTIVDDDEPPVLLADLSVLKTDNFDPVTVGAQLTYAIAVFNGGPAPAENVTLTDPLPAGVTFVRASPTAGSCDGTVVVTCQLGTLAANTGAVVTIVVVPQAGGTLDNTATATTTSVDPNTLNNSESEQTTVGPPTVTVGNESVTEGNDGDTPLTFTVRRSTTVGTSSVGYATSDETATVGDDYEAATGTLVFEQGEDTKTITVNVVGDLLDEPNETFLLTLTAVSNVAVPAGPARGTIIDDDEPPPPVLAIGDATVTEGNTGSVAAVFTVTRTPGTGASTVDWATGGGSATAGSDYTAASGSLSFEGDETEQTITVSVLGDTLSEANETYLVTLSNPVGATIADGQGTGTIVDDDASPPLVPLVIAGPCSDQGTLRDDEITGNSAPNWICGRRGADTLLGLGGGDRLLGGDGEDLLDGGLGADNLAGGPGNDVIDAFGDGADVVNGGAGFDTCYCGPEDSVTGIERFIPHGK